MVITHILVFRFWDMVELAFLFMSVGASTCFVTSLSFVDIYKIKIFEEYYKYKISLFHFCDILK